MSADDQMAQLFVEEARESLRDFEQALLMLESLPDDAELIGRLFRCAHTLKGNSRIMGYEVVTTFTHELENLLDGLRCGELMVSHAIADTLLSALDQLKALVAEIGGGPAHEPASYAAELTRLREAAGDLKMERPREPAAPLLEFTEPVRVTVAPQLSERRVSVTPPADGKRVAPAAEKAVERRLTGSDEASSVRVPIDKLDRLINLTGEVVIAQSMIAQLVTDLTPERVSALQEVVAQMDRHCRELQERMLGARMLPVRNVFVRFHRVVRDLSASTMKEISLELAGEETELDKTVIEKIADPLTHLVRNAIDHGIELPEERVAAGKPAHAKVSLSAYQKGGSIFIEVSDDGRGIDCDKVVEKAKARGLVHADAQLDEEAALALIFMPGFSTADRVTELSGRGVGMDVVKRNVEALKGTINTSSVKGKGTTFRLKLPLTLAILDGLGVRVGSDVYLVPLVSVIESLQPRVEDVHVLPSLGDVVDVRGEFLPLVRLFEVFNVEPMFPNAHDGIVMVLDDGTQKLVLQVDELIGQYQVVIKSLESNFQAVPGVAGATVLGDGRVALILDAGQLAGLARARGGRVANDTTPYRLSAASGGAE